MITHGLISDLDARTLEASLNLILDKFPDDQTIYITEVGLFNCATIAGMYNYITAQDRSPICTGIDSQKDKPIIAPWWLRFLVGQSAEVYYELDDESQHLIFLDANHSFAHVVQDFYCYADKLKVGGLMAFHDTGKHIKAYFGYQGGPVENPDNYIAVRRALNAIGLLKGKLPDWRLVYDREDQADEMGGICVFQKMFA